MSEVRFYHLEHKTVEQVLPAMVATSLGRGLTMTIKSSSGERLEALSTLLWTHDAASFLPHGRDGDSSPGLQPVWLTLGDDAPNGAAYRFFVDGAEPADLSAAERAIILFDGADVDAVDTARGLWRRFKGEGHTISYWQQDEQGIWKNRAGDG
jgi:DNA polymerase-3 subunit chi